MNRKITRLFTATVMLGAMITLNSCKGKKDLPKGEVEVKMYCSGPDYWTDKHNFRANSVGESIDQATAQKKARANAKQQIAGDISTVLKATIDNYVKSTEFNNKEEVLENFEGLSREVINQELSGIKTICEQLTKDQTTTKYKYYVAIELSADKLVQKYTERLSKNEALKVDYNYEKFKQTFDKEMDRMAGEN